ncbi:MAG: lipocalin family protein [Candidatus Thiodiazotropha sp. (ex Codakia rugifera)]|nr:lipocalin family protein [Candidatus Thiodiazotropha sp. (ex Codakia rugifera)]
MQKNINGLLHLSTLSGCANLVAISLAGCTDLPKGIQPVDDFKINHYLGTWYEIARLDHAFESDLDSVTADYTFRKDGGIDVINRGRSTRDNQWKEAEGKAYFVGDNKKGHLKVSLFWPFYSAYVIFKLDRERYKYAYISGYNREYLWLLVRSPRISKEVIGDFMTVSESFEFNTKDIIMVEHDLPIGH